jgi:membrane protease YdiL (CAAX protease family)
MDRCAPCGATLYGEAEWCGQCFAPRRTAAPNPFAPRAALVGAPAAVAAPPSPFGSGPGIPRYDAGFPDQNGVVEAPVEVRTGKLAKADEGKVAKPLGAILLLGLLVQVALYLHSGGSAGSIASQIRTGQWVILGFYAVVLAIVVRMAGTVDFRPLWSSGATAENAAVGALKGVVTATVVLLLVSTATGRVQVAPSVKFELGDATLFSIAVALLGMVVAAPVVEELLFRGFVGEAMRHRGQVVALVGSSVLFALWHMRFGVVQILYYTVLGVMLGRTYWKRGLVASMAAHAGFNGTLVVVALVFILGPGATMSANGVSIHAPGGWDEIDTAEVPGVPSAILAAHGPSSAVIVILADPLPAGVSEDEVREYARGVEAAAAATGGAKLASPAAGSARMATYPAGEAVRVPLRHPGNAGEVAVFFHGGYEWKVILQHATDRTRDDFEEMLQSLRLP